MNQYQCILAINLWIYLYFFEEQERFRDSCLLQGNNQSIAADLKELTFWLYQTYGQRAGLGWGDQWYSFPILGTTTHQYPPTRRKPKLLPKTTKSCHKRSLPLGRGTLVGENKRYCKHSDFLSWQGFGLLYLCWSQANWDKEILLLNVLWHLVFKLNLLIINMHSLFLTIFEL